VKFLPALLLSILVPAGIPLIPAEEPAESLTAQEYFTKAGEAFGAGDHARAADLYGKLIADFGQSPDAAEAIRKIRFPHAICLIHAKMFRESLEPLQTALDLQPPLPPAEVQELQFWLGVANLEEKNYADARAALEQFLKLFPDGAEKSPAIIRQYPSAVKIPEARLLIGSAWQAEGNPKEAAAYFAGIKPDLIPENRARAVVLELHALLESDQNDAALALVEEEFPHMDDIPQLVTFQCLTLELGNRWLEAGEARKAIRCLQRVWASERLLRHQQARLDDLETRLQAAEATPGGDAYTKFLLAGLIQKVRREIDHFQKLPSFDAAVRLRLATAYQSMYRYREAALILESMLDQMPADPVVEQASANLAQAWFELERWPKVGESAKAFGTRFPDSDRLPMVDYLAGLAAQRDLRYSEALAAFDALQKGDSDFAPRALFMLGFTRLLAEDNAGAIAIFEKFGKRFPKHELAEAAAYWRGMGYSLDRQFEKSRRAMDGYLKKFPDGPHAGHAAFRKAYCAQQLEDFVTSRKELRAFLRANPKHEEASEARILLADALMDEGRLEDGIAILSDIPRSDTRFYEEGVFKSGKALKLMEEPDRFLALMQEFQKKNPRSPRVAEAIYNIGWVYRQRDEPDKARDVYWEAIRDYGNDPSIRSVESLFPALAKLYRGDEARAQYLVRLQDLQDGAEKSDKKTLAVRTLWARAAALKKSDPEAARQLLLEAAARAPVESTNPLLLADFAGAWKESGETGKAAAMYRDLLKWNPRAPQKPEALAGLGFADLEQGDEKAARQWFERFENECPPSRSSGPVLLAHAAMEEKRGRQAAARKLLESLLACEFSTGREKAEALFRIGQIHLADNEPGLAIPYFQRLYVMHGRWTDWVAKAYLQSGVAFEKLKDPDSARKTYQELLANKDLAECPESAAAKSRLAALGGPLPDNTPTPEG